MHLIAGEQWQVAAHYHQLHEVLRLEWFKFIMQTISLFVREYDSLRARSSLCLLRLLELRHPINITTANSIKIIYDLIVITMTVNVIIWFVLSVKRIHATVSQKHPRNEYSWLRIIATYSVTEVRTAHISNVWCWSFHSKSAALCCVPSNEAGLLLQMINDWSSGQTTNECILEKWLMENPNY